MPSRMKPITQKMMIANGRTRSTATTISQIVTSGAVSESP